LTVSVDPVAAETLHLSAQIPLDRLDFAYGTGFAGEPETKVAARAEWLTDLVANRVSLTDVDGTTWATDVQSVAADELEGIPVLDVEVLAVAPAGQTSEQVDLRWGVVTDVIYTHEVYVGGVASPGRPSWWG
jgi:hypothetical protein